MEPAGTTVRSVQAQALVAHGVLPCGSAAFALPPTCAGNALHLPAVPWRAARRAAAPSQTRAWELPHGRSALRPNDGCEHRVVDAAPHPRGAAAHVMQREWVGTPPTLMGPASTSDSAFTRHVALRNGTRRTGDAHRRHAPAPRSQVRNPLLFVPNGYDLRPTCTHLAEPAAALHP